MRSLLFVPADSQKKLQKALSSGADVLILDLEDSVAPSRKEEARRIAAEFTAAHRSDCPALLYVRVNALSTGLTDDDLKALIPAQPAGVMLPKSNSGQDVTRLSVKLRVHEAENGLEDGATRILPIITETAAGVFAAGTYAGASKRLAGLTWGAEDLSAELGASTTRDEAGNFNDAFRLARAVTLLGASAANVPAIDTVYPNFRDESGFAKECAEAERDGFTAKMAIHPAQVPVINAAFTPSRKAIEESRRVANAFATAGETGVASVDGQMIDRPHLRRAERILERARLAGLE